MKRIVASLTLCIGGAVILFMVPGWLDRIRHKSEHRYPSVKSDMWN